MIAYGGAIQTVEEYIADNERYPNAARYRDRKRFGEEAVAAGSRYIREYSEHDGPRVSVHRRHAESQGDLARTIKV